MKRFLACLAVLAVMLFSSGSFAQTSNLIANGSFESLDSNGMPSGWYTNAYRAQEGYTRFIVTDAKAHSGKYSAMIENLNVNDARYIATIKVEPESMYRFSGYVLVEEMEDIGNGANLALEDVYSFSECLYDTAGEWKYVEWYGETDTDQTEATVGVRIGGYGAESQGKAYFDDIEVVKVDTLPGNLIASLWYTPQEAMLQSDAVTTVDGLPKANTGLLCGLAALFAVLGFWACQSRLSAPQDLQKPDGRTMTVLALCVGLLIALIARLILAYNIEGYQVDMNCFTAWSLKMAQSGPAGFYEEGYFCDYPPGYLYVLWLNGLLLRTVPLSDAGTVRLIIKLFPVLCDIALAILLFGFARKRIGERPAVLLSLLFAFNPAALVNGAAWGQVDTVLALMLVLSGICAMQKKWRLALPVFMAAILIKPQALLLAPVGLVWLIVSCWRSADARKQWLEALWGLLIGAAVSLAIIIPFSIKQSNVWWLFDLYRDTLSSYAYATLNTANFYYLLGANWASLSDSVSVLLPIVTGLALMLLGAAGWFIHGKNGKGPRKIYLSLLTGVFGAAFLISACFPATYQSYGTMMMVYVYAAVLLMLAVEKKAETLPFMMALTLIGLYVFGIKIHERYLFAALALLLVAYATTRDKRTLLLAIGFSATTFLNSGIILDNSIRLGASFGHLNADTLGLNIIISILNIALAGYAGYLGYSGLRESPAKRTAPVSQAAASESAYHSELLHPRDASMRIDRPDVLIMLVTSLFFAGLTFTNLGSTKAPQTAWVATSPDEQVVLELAQEETFSLLYYAGVSYNDFSIAVSSDGLTWSSEYPCEMREGLCYRWLYAVEAVQTGGEVTYRDGSADTKLRLTGKYLRITAQSAGLNLWEVIARGTDGQNLPLTVTSHTGYRDTQSKPVSNLLDEQDTMHGEPGWYYGTYFDEIYHARTAYEHLHGQIPYETTHPPLGKLMMSACIAIFGMTPFGWRFAGALIGVLMLPALYLLAKQLTKRRDLAAFAMLLMTFDLMHFTQTRIATIDSFPVFFILLSYLCMARYVMSDHFASYGNDSLDQAPRVITRAYLRSLTPLLLCGVTMGLGIASKWIGLYSAVGLAVLFFWSCYRQLRVMREALRCEDQKLSAEQKLRVRNACELTLRWVVVTCLFCVVFFIAIPALIYYLSYIPYLSPSGPVTMKRIIQAQESMLSYHSTPGLGMDHPYQSPWYQWPFILKPMWFARDQYEPAGFQSTIMCMGNPLVFYAGAICMLCVIFLYLRKFVAFRGGVRLKRGDGELATPIVVIGFLAQYLPWVLVPRSMFIYHYFASVPFIIIATAMMAGRLPQKPKWLRPWALWGFVVACAVLFVLFYPYASGILTPVSWLDAMKWFPKIYY